MFINNAFCWLKENTYDNEGTEDVLLTGDSNKLLNPPLEADRRVWRFTLVFMYEEFRRYSTSATSVIPSPVAHPPGRHQYIAGEAQV